MSYLPVVVIFIAVVGAYAFYMVKGAKGKANKYTQAHSEATSMFEENREQILKGYLEDKEKFGIITDVLPGETIIGIANYVEPKSVGKSLTEGLKTAVTKVRKVNMDLFFMVITDKNLHCIECDGENTVDHTVFDLSLIENMTASKGGGLNIKDSITGASGDFNKVTFTYKGKEYSYNLYKIPVGYPCFDVHKDSMSGEFYRTHPGRCDDYHKMTSKEAQLEYLVNDRFLKGFKDELQKRFGTTLA